MNGEVVKNGLHRTTEYLRGPGIITFHTGCCNRYAPAVLSKI